MEQVIDLDMLPEDDTTDQRLGQRNKIPEGIDSNEFIFPIYDIEE